MELRRHLSDILASRPDWYRALLATIAERLRVTACEGVIRPGEPMPDFVLPNAEGDLVFSDEMLARGPLVVCFVRGDWCPFCRTNLTALEEALPDIEAAGATLVALMPDTAGHATRAKSALDLHYQVLSDVDNAVGLRFGAVYRVPDEYRDALLSFGIDLGKRHGAETCMLPLPATIIVDAGGIVRSVHVSGDVTDRAEPRDVVACLRALKAGPAASYDR